MKHMNNLFYQSSFDKTLNLYKYINFMFHNQDLYFLLLDLYFLLLDLYFLLLDLYFLFLYFFDNFVLQWQIISLHFLHFFLDFLQ